MKKRNNRATDIHHYSHPKRLYKDSENIFIKLDYDFHHGYHNFFDAHCHSPKFRQCLNCKYEGICCYKNSDVWYGERIPH